MSDGPSESPTFTTQSLRRALRRADPRASLARLIACAMAEGTLSRKDDPTGGHRRWSIKENALHSTRTMSLHKFRVNPPKPYSERMTETRSEVRRLVNAMLCEITGSPTATMKWARSAYLKGVVARYRVRLEGWPLAEVPFKNLSDVPNLGKLELLLHGLQDGTIHFVHINEEQYRAMMADPSPWVGQQDYVEEAEADDA